MERHQIVEAQLADRLRKMVGFRNIAVHDYQIIKLEILKTILEKHLQDLEEFYTVVIKKFK